MERHWLWLFLTWLPACSSLRGPRIVSLENSTETTLDIKWTPVASTNVNMYTVRASPIQTYSPILGPSQEWKYTSARQAGLLGLHPGTLYNVSVWADTSEGPSETTSIVVWTEVGEPDLPPTVQVLSRNDTQMVVQLSPGTSSKGPITGYRMIAFERSSLMAFSPERLAGHREAAEAGTPFYVAAELGPEWENKTFVFGDGRSYGGFLNAPLSPSEDYLPIQGVASSLNGITKYAYSVESPSTERIQPPIIVMDERSQVLSSWLSAATALGACLLLAFIAAYVFARRHYSRRRRRTEELMLRSHPSLDLDDVTPFSAGSLQLGEGADLGAFYNQLRSMLPMVPQSRLLLSDTMLGQGRFGPVRAGHLVTDDSRKVPVSVQRCPAEWTLPDHERRSLLADIEGMLRLGSHPNVVQFMGACEDEPELLQLAMEQPSSSLRGLLLTSRHSAEGRVSAIPEERLVDLLVSLAAGMHHLSSRGVQHGQLSTRSITMVEPLVPKISYFGLARYSPLGKVRSRHPWRRGWVLTEALCFAETGLHSLVVLRSAYVGNVHLSYRLMQQCWHQQARDRPTFQELRCSLQALQPLSIDFLLDTAVEIRIICRAMTRDFSFLDRSTESRRSLGAGCALTLGVVSIASCEALDTRSCERAFVLRASPQKTRPSRSSTCCNHRGAGWRHRWLTTRVPDRRRGPSWRCPLTRHFGKAGFCMGMTVSMRHTPRYSSHSEESFHRQDRFARALCRIPEARTHPLQSQSTVQKKDAPENVRC
ncbi:hypothetical protein HPB51_017926 [Rhipicephalus microplus]|uniref:Uncharacterized protein n=1 Tax=Rhipicephalus microplus TaxID=6941 RepID=A0A9J6ENS0_RHIMP|nr:hypothetical protein HPB51_017926 [Rhipicephalus microplus]